MNCYIRVQNALSREKLVPHATRIRALRKRLGITQSELARVTGYTPTAISLYELGKRNPSPRFLRLLAEFEKAPLLARPPSLESRMAVLEARMTGLEARLAEGLAKLESRLAAAGPDPGAAKEMGRDSLMDSEAPDQISPPGGHPR